METDVKKCPFKVVYKDTCTSKSDKDFINIGNERIENVVKNSKFVYHDDVYVVFEHYNSHRAFNYLWKIYFLGELESWKNAILHVILKLLLCVIYFTILYKLLVWG